MDTHIHNNYNIFLNTIIHLMIIEIYTNNRLDINNEEQPTPENNNNSDNPENIGNLNAHSNKLITSNYNNNDIFIHDNN